MNTLGEQLAAEERYSDAIAIYELNSEFFPESTSILGTLGNLYEQINETETAIGYYERVLELRPNNRRAQERLAELRGR